MNWDDGNEERGRRGHGQEEEGGVTEGDTGQEEVEKPGLRET